MKRPLVVVLLLLGLASAPASAAPGVDVLFENDLLRVTLQGSYAGRYYQVWRAAEALGSYEPRLDQLALCTGDCFVADPDVTPGKTYFYRFVVRSGDGSQVEYGPFPVTVPDTPVGARLAPNPFEGDAVVVLSIPGSARRDAPVEAEARILDLQGRSVRVLHSGPLARGETRLRWDGRGGDGERLGSGVYFLRFRTPLGVAVRRIVRVR